MKTEFLHDLLFQIDFLRFSCAMLGKAKYILLV